MRIVVRDSAHLSRYRFGLKTAEFLVCSKCGVYIGALMEQPDGHWFTVNVNAFRPPPPDDFPMQPADYDAEDVAARIARRKIRWTPVVAFEIGS